MSKAEGTSSADLGGSSNFANDEFLILKTDVEMVSM